MIFLLLASFSFFGNVRDSTDSAIAPQHRLLQLFWQDFRAAVIADDTARVMQLSKFPIGMSYGIPAIRNESQFRKRYGEIFSEQCNAKVCFKDAKPQNILRRSFEVYCPMTGGDTVIVFHFYNTKKGWRFGDFDNINE